MAERVGCGLLDKFKVEAKAEERRWTHISPSLSRPSHEVKLRVGDEGDTYHHHHLLFSYLSLDEILSWWHKFPSMGLCSRMGFNHRWFRSWVKFWDVKVARFYLSRGNWRVRSWKTSRLTILLWFKFTVIFKFIIILRWASRESRVVTLLSPDFEWRLIRSKIFVINIIFLMSQWSTSSLPWYLVGG